MIKESKTGKAEKTKSVFLSDSLQGATAGLSLRNSVNTSQMMTVRDPEAGIWSSASCLMAEDFLLGHEIPSASGFHLCVLAQNPIDVGESSQMEKQRAAGTCRKKL